ncbi:HAAS signaling domain-containing protein [Staphylococcus cohnii]|uniref:HAAS signaling domain-containing protein n=1 Tax=Staphylococcus TaxID=1279 RepID=UPI001AEBF381|nr:DUF1700 domain-containing protein [Staphylococcus sp. GDY8P94P]
MTKNEFLKQLHRHLKHDSDAERQDILNEYETHFYSGLKEGKTEAQISKELGDPRTLAKEMNATAAVEKAADSKKFGDVGNAIFAVMGLSILNFFVILVPFIFVLSIVVSLIVTTISFVLSPILLLVKGFLSGFENVLLFDVYAVGALFGMGLMLFVITYLISKAFYLICVKYLKWNISVVKKSGIS